MEGFIGLRIVKVMEKVKEEVLKDPILKRIVDVIVKEIDPDKIILFGSRARGDYNEYSDYDILVLKKGVKPEERRKLEGDIELLLLKEGIYNPADIIVRDPLDYEKLGNYLGKIYRQIKMEGVLIYECKRGKRVD